MNATLLTIALTFLFGGGAMIQGADGCDFWLVLGAICLGIGTLAGGWLGVRLLRRRLHATQRRSDLHGLVSIELVRVVDEGRKLYEAGGIGDMPGVKVWFEKTSQFLETVLGHEERQRFQRPAKGVIFYGGPEELNACIEVIHELQDHSDGWEIREDRDGVLLAAVERRTLTRGQQLLSVGGPLETTAEVSRIDDLMRHGLDLVKDLERPSPSGEPEVALSKEDVDRAHEFDDQARSLLREIRPSLLRDYTKGMSEFLNKEGEKANKRAKKLEDDGADNGEKLRVWFDRLRLRPALYVQASLEGLADARDRLS